MKTCTGCRLAKPISEFPIRKERTLAKCRVCESARQKAWREKNPGYSASYNATWKAANPEKVREHKARDRKKNSERYRAHSARHYQANKGKLRALGALWNEANPEKRRAIGRNWHKRHPAKSTAEVRKRQAAKIQATPPWANLDGIRVFYEMAARVSKCLGIKHHVDHICPLRGADGSRGLHVEYNLRVIPAVVNLRKGNRV